MTDEGERESSSKKIILFSFEVFCHQRKKRFIFFQKKALHNRKVGRKKREKECFFRFISEKQRGSESKGKRKKKRRRFKKYMYSRFLSLFLLLHLFWCLTNARLAHATTIKPAAKPAPMPNCPHAVGTLLPFSSPPMP